jgi:hypothetical protein
VNELVAELLGAGGSRDELLGTAAAVTVIAPEQFTVLVPPQFAVAVMV